MRRKVCVVVTARPSYSRIKSALVAIRDHPDLELQLVVAASALLHNYGNVVNNIQNDGFYVAERIYTVIEGENLVTMAKTTGLGLIELATSFDNLKPDVVVTIADRSETIATAIAASYMNIPVAHVQGGEVTGSIDEKVRHAITKLSNLHFVATAKAARRVRQMGEADESVFVTGCPSIDLAAEVLAHPTLDFDPAEKYGGVGTGAALTNGYLVVLQHPVTTEYPEARRHITETLKAVHALDLPTFWFWPNVDAGSDGTSEGIRAFREQHRPAHIRFFRNMESSDFLRLVYGSRCIVGNSSVAIRECAFLGVPGVNIGTRQTGRDRGANVVDVDYDYCAIRAAVERQARRSKLQSDPIYGDGDAGNRIAQLLMTQPLCADKRLAY